MKKKSIEKIIFLKKKIFKDNRGELIKPFSKIFVKNFNVGECYYTYSKKNVISENEFKTKLDDLKKQITEYRLKRQNIIQESTKKRVQASAEFSNQIKPILGDYAAKNNISIIVQKKNIIMGKKELDITLDILKIVDEKIKKIKFD